MKNKLSLFALMIALAMPLSLLSMKKRDRRKASRKKKKQSLRISLKECAQCYNNGKKNKYDGITVSTSPGRGNSPKRRKKKNGNKRKKGAQKTIKTPWH